MLKHEDRTTCVGGAASLRRGADGEYLGGLLKALVHATDCRRMSPQGRTPLTVSVGGGKGGVGKSVVASNLGIAIARLGFRVVLVDADLGSANLHTLFGVERPGHTLQAFVDKRIGSLEEALVSTGEPRLFLLPGTSGVADATNVAHATKLKLIRHLQSLDADVVLIDCGAGASFNVLDFFDLADLRVVVTTPQLTALQNAYGFLKSAVYRSLRQHALSTAEKHAFDGASTRCETERVRHVLRRLEPKAPVFVRSIERYLAHFGAFLVGNQVEHPGQERTFTAFTRMAEDFLSIEVPLAATLPASSRVHASVTRRRPILMDNLSGTFAHSFAAFAERLLTTDSTRLREGRRRHESEPPPNGGQPGPLANYVRRHARVKTRQVVRVTAGRRSARAEVLDVSESGMRLASLIPVAPGARLVVRFAEGAGPAFAVKVRWVKKGQLGLELADPNLGPKLLEVAGGPRRDSDRLAPTG